jgi:hypothetical protein
LIAANKKYQQIRSVLASIFSVATRLHQKPITGTEKVIEENTESYVVNSTKGLKEHEQVLSNHLVPFIMDIVLDSSLLVSLLKIYLIIF